MQRLQKSLGVGLVLGLMMSLATTAQAQVFYEQSNFQVVPVSQSVVVTRSIGVYHSSNSFGASQAWNNRPSAPAAYFEPTYLPESGDYYPPISSRSIAVTQPVVTSRVAYSQPRVYSQPVVYSEPVVMLQPVRVYSSVVSSPRVTREEIEYRPGHYEYEQKGKFQAFDGRRVKTYRYKYEVDQRHGWTKYKFDIDD